MVGFYLIITKKIRPSGLRKIVKSWFREKYKSEISGFVKEDGFCWIAVLPDYLCSDLDSGSSLRLFENGKEIGIPHCSHQEIREIGLGRYSHWGNSLYFSTPDNSNPNENNRKYSVEEI
jgi:hypothetical protein